MDLRGIAYECQVAQLIQYKGVHLPKGYVIDLLVENAVIVEVKSSVVFRASVVRSS